MSLSLRLALGELIQRVCDVLGAFDRADITRISGVWCLVGLSELIEGATREELIWMNGYLAGLIGTPIQKEVPRQFSVSKITIVFGTDTGNSKKLALEFATKAKKSGMQTKKDRSPRSSRLILCTYPRRIYRFPKD